MQIAEQQQRLEGLFETRPIKVILELVEEDNYWFADFEAVGECAVGISASHRPKPWGGKEEALKDIEEHVKFEETLFPFIRGYEIVETYNFKTREEYIAWARTRWNTSPK